MYKIRLAYGLIQELQNGCWTDKPVKAPFGELYSAKYRIGAIKKRTLKH